MFGQNVNKLIIVCDESTQEYANYLRQLVSSKDDEENEVVGTKDGSVDAVVWLEKDYVANMVLFLLANMFFLSVKIKLVRQKFLAWTLNLINIV